MVKWFDKLRNVKRRGGFLPGRFRFSSRSGVTLVELMISMLILAIVCISWLQIIGIQSARKEARRREAVERLAGMMDAFMYMGRSGEIPEKTIGNGKYYKMDLGGGGNCNFNVDKSKRVNPLFDEVDKYGDRVSPIGYQLFVIGRENDLNHASKSEVNWHVEGAKNIWLIGNLYDHSDCTKEEAGNPFFVLSVCLGM